ncbi:lipoate--protein ligase family protein [Pseudogemmatithrix spongiicola]|uniref:Lipoate--protein ligase family protein n=1 Tax=Pseudogemmatithrix spongiicola TaxID=3062599 RepID=A0AA49JY56_9BACT|nr:lipoate--protein ligase family protein [Gemmatimonadaceae bacterium 'strain 138']WKW14214.1 lipoate--protein ligase family protein [Gemmatimonadaceae bacterium 'strain 318']
MPLPTRWRLLVTPADDGDRNMAIDHALLDRAAHTDEAVFRIYAWAHPTLSLGMHEKARLEPDAAATRGIAVVRRPTGGRALLHHREVTYSVTAPARDASLRESYDAINAILLDALTRLGVPAAPAERRGRPLAPDGAACFAEPNVGELVVDGRKLVGSAQRRDEHAFLQHGSILLADDQGLVAALRGTTAPPPAATLTQALRRDVDFDEVRDALIAALEHAVGPVSTLAVGELAPAIARHVATYRDPRWTFRR